MLSNYWKSSAIWLVQKPDEQINLRPSNWQDCRTNGISGAMVYCGFLCIPSVLSRTPIICKFKCIALIILYAAEFMLRLAYFQFQEFIRKTYTGNDTNNNLKDKKRDQLMLQTSGDSRPWPTINSTATMQRTWCHKKALPLTLITQSWFPSKLQKRRFMQLRKEHSTSSNEKWRRAGYKL